MIVFLLYLVIFGFAYVAYRFWERSPASHSRLRQPENGDLRR
jgi:hypothetical protein